MFSFAAHRLGCDWKLLSIKVEHFAAPWYIVNETKMIGFRGIHNFLRLPSSCKARNCVMTSVMFWRNFFTPGNKLSQHVAKILDGMRRQQRRQLRICKVWPNPRVSLREFVGPKLYKELTVKTPKATWGPSSHSFFRGLARHLIGLAFTGADLINSQVFFQFIYLLHVYNCKTYYLVENKCDSTKTVIN